MSDQVRDDVADEMLAKAMLKLSFDELSAVNEELHGVKCLAIPENPELLSRALKDFQREIDQTETNASSVSKKKAYNMILSRREEEKERNRSRLVSSSDTPSIAAVSEAVYTKNHYAIDDDDFRLRFLRVELFDVQKAVNRFLNYLNLVHEFWGEIALEHPIYLKDLLASKEDREFLKKGYRQILPFRDRSGRKIVMDVGDFMNPDQRELVSPGSLVEEHQTAIAIAKNYLVRWFVSLTIIPLRFIWKSRKRGICVKYVSLFTTRQLAIASKVSG